MELIIWISKVAFAVMKPSPPLAFEKFKINIAWMSQLIQLTLINRCR